MENDFDYQSVPPNYTHCINFQCVRKEQCLRHLAWQKRTSQHLTIHILNPNCISADTTTCPHFQSTQKVRMAWGIKNLYDNLPYKSANAIRRQIVNHYGKTLYYRFYREERPLMPEEQAFIRRVFKKNGITEEPKFERYTEQQNYNS